MKKTSILLFALLSLSLCYGQTKNHTLTIRLSVAPDMLTNFKSAGRVLVLLERDGKEEPRNNLWPPRPGFTILARNVSNWSSKKILRLNDFKKWDKTGSWDLSSVPQGRYSLQILWKQTGAGLGANSPGNLYSRTHNIQIDSAQQLDIDLSRQIAEPKLVHHKLVKELSIKSDTLSAWWHKAMYQKAAVLLPSGYFKNPGQQYPVRYNIGGYGNRYTRVNKLVLDKDFISWWMSDNAPQIITVFLDPAGPFGDNYHLDSKNSGPYGYALIHELIPYIERTFRAKPDAKYRFVDGCSTGGWVSLALQLLYPDMFNGCWSYSPDPVDFHYTQLINIYDDENAFYNMRGFERPSERTTLGSPNFSIQQEVAFENIQGNSGSYVTSGEQWGAWTALFSPRGKNGLPLEIFDPVSGRIDKKTALYWKKYDLLSYLKQNWPALGPALQGKIYIWMGDMDNYYLNNAMRSFDRFIKQTHAPVSDAVIEFTPLKGHCAFYGHRHVLEGIAKKIKTLK